MTLQHFLFISLAILAIILVGGAVYIFKSAALIRIERNFAELRTMVQLYETANTNIITSLMSIEESLLVARAISDEIDTSDSSATERASELLSSQRRRVMKMIHHAGLSSSDEHKALLSSWALATEFGDADTIELMRSLERLRRGSSVNLFREHREILADRLQTALVSKR